MNELLNCPFCGEPADTDEVDKYNFIAFCSNEYCIGRSVDGVVEQWNKRVPLADSTGKVLLAKGQHEELLRDKARLDWLDSSYKADDCHRLNRATIDEAMSVEEP